MFATVEKLRAGALLVGADPSFNNSRGRLIALAERRESPRSTAIASSPWTAA